MKTDGVSCQLDTHRTNRYSPSVVKIEIEREVDGGWLAEVGDLPGVMAYAETRSEAIAK